jgi:hypothetical protein
MVFPESRSGVYTLFHEYAERVRRIVAERGALR